MSDPVTRRDLAFAAAIAASAVPTLAADSNYSGPLDGVAPGKVDLQTLDPVAWTRKRYASAPLRLSFRAKSKPEAEQWQRTLHSKLVELLGGFPPQRVALAPETLEVKQFPGYKREKFIFTSRPGLLVLGYLLTPVKTAGPYAPVLCIPGHGRGVDDLVGIDDKGRDRTNKEGYQHDFAIQCVEHGFAAVALEPMAFGCRRDARTQKKGLGSSACQPSAGAALLLGETMIGWRVYDTMRAIDWISTRRELDAKRVGCVGISGGGTCALFTTALDPRVRSVLVSGYLNTFRDSILSLSHCIDNYIPGILNWAEMYDVAGLIAPRPMAVESGERDNIFPIAASRESVARVRKVYDVFGATDQLHHEVFDNDHQFSGKEGLPFLAKHLQG